MGQHGAGKGKGNPAKAFRPYQINAQLMSHCPNALFMHCLPARRGEEVTDEVIDGKQSVVVTQAANRMHVQKAFSVASWPSLTSCFEKFRSFATFPEYGILNDQKLFDHSKL